MKNSEETHRYTEFVYRGLTDNFNPGVKQILITGKAYHKTLQGVTAAARAFTETLLRVGSTARTNCRGGTEDIGDAIFQIAEAQKEIQARIEENTKALFTELVLPLEQKLENEFKRTAAQHRKYANGHKVVVAPYIKAAESLKKFRKKTKNKPTIDEQKEDMHLKTLGKCQVKLDEFRVQGLKLALLEERKCHCFLLDRLSTIASMQNLHHRQAADILGMGLPSWKQLATKPHILPPEANRFLMLNRDIDMDHMNGSVYRMSNGFIADETRSLGSPYRRSVSAHDSQRFPLSSYGSEGGYAKTIPHTRGISVPPPPPPGSSQVRALYTHVGEGENKLSFTDGDIINLVGDRTEGWQYGLNTRSGRYGWFPLSFTEPMSTYARDHSLLSHRVKSMGDLDFHSMSDGESFFVDPDVPGSSRRPRSLYESSGLKLVNNTAQHFSPGGWSSGNSANMLGSYSLPRQFTADRGNYFHDQHGTYSSDYGYHHQFLPSDAQLQPNIQIHNSSGPAACMSDIPVLPSPPLPPPPPPIPTPPNTAAPSSLPTPSSLSAPSSLPAPPPASLDPFVLAGSLRLHSPAFSRKTSFKHLQKSDSKSSNVSSSAAPKSQAPPPPPPPPPPPVGLTAPKSHPSVLSLTTLSQNNHSSGKGSGASGYGKNVRQMPDHAHPPPPPPTSSQSGDDNRPRPPSTMAPLPPGSEDRYPTEDYGMDEDDSNYKRNPKFATVNLKSTVTNDRSKPRI